MLDNGVLICAFGTRDIQVMCDVSGTGHHWSAPLPIYRGQGSGYTDVQALGADTFRLVYDESSFFEEHAGGHRIVRVVLQALKTESDHPLPDR
ncbi:MAG: hypothetical protein BWY76_02376 [bacterium ADurb.Bin429]|nr:MAG: hypothetical protein BWY76_02376 [bacterium ADurb.Bin429]